MNPDVQITWIVVGGGVITATIITVAFLISQIIEVYRQKIK